MTYKTDPRKELERINSAIEAQEGLRGVLSDEQLAEILRPLKEKYRQLEAIVKGGGAIAQAEEGATAAGSGGVAIGGDHIGDINIHPEGEVKPDRECLQDAYLNRVMAQCSYLSLAGIDPAMAGQRDATDARLSLNAVYTALLTRSPREELGRRKPQEMIPGREERQQSALEQVDRYQLLVLQGEPGSGKSTFVRFVALCLAGETLSDPKANLKRLTEPLPGEQGEDDEKPQTWRHDILIPVIVILRDFAASGLPEQGERGTAEHLWRFIEKRLEEDTLADYAPYLKKNLLEGGGLLLLDGLDEVPEAEKRREQVKDAVESFVKVHRNCRVLVTSRTYAYQNQEWRLGGFREAVLAPLSDGQIKGFVSSWYQHAASLGRLSEEDAAGRAQLLQQAIFGQPRLRELAERPLLLTLIASLHAWRGGNLPERRERLYADTVDLLLDFWEQRRIKRLPTGEPTLLQPSLAEWLRSDREQVRGVLESLAFEIHKTQPELVGTADISEDALVGRLLRLSPDPEANPKRLVEYLRDRAGLLMSRGVGVYSFPHRSFQEYLAACHLTGESYPDEVAEFARTDPDRWREVALLAGAKAARGTAATIWLLANSLCYRSVDEPGIGREDEWGAQIAAQALVESADLSRVGPANRARLARIRDWMIRLMRSSHLPVTERAQAGDNVGTLGDPRFDAKYWYLPREPLLGFIGITAGAFRMGSDSGYDDFALDEEMPRHEVSLPSCYMARWPVTVAQFRVFVETTGYRPIDSNSLKDSPNHPVVYVNWHDAMAYCRWLGQGLRDLARDRILMKGLSEHERCFWQALAKGDLGAGLPSEAEWEKAARGVAGRIYSWGDDYEAERLNGSDAGLGRNSAVGCFAGGAGPYGCEEMSGNVWEWTRSLWGKDLEKPEFAYPYDPDDGREDLNAPKDIRRVLRGGAFYGDRSGVRCACRGRDVPDGRDRAGGFRVVLSPFFSER